MFYLPTPMVFPEFISRLKGNANDNSFVVLMILVSSSVGKPGRLISTAPVVLCIEGSNWPVVSCPSAGAT